MEFVIFNREIGGGFSKKVAFEQLKEVMETCFYDISKTEGADRERQKCAVYI